MRLSFHKRYCSRTINDADIVNKKMAHTLTTYNIIWMRENSFYEEIKIKIKSEIVSWTSCVMYSSAVYIFIAKWCINHKEKETLRNAQYQVIQLYDLKRLTGLKKFFCYKFASTIFQFNIFHNYRVFFL